MLDLSRLAQGPPDERLPPVFVGKEDRFRLLAAAARAPASREYFVIIRVPTLAKAKLAP
jgi:hypothetical protein